MRSKTTFKIPKINKMTMLPSPETLCPIKSSSVVNIFDESNTTESECIVKSERLNFSGSFKELQERTATHVHQEPNRLLDADTTRAIRDKKE